MQFILLSDHYGLFPQPHEEMDVIGRMSGSARQVNRTEVNFGELKIRYNIGGGDTYFRAPGATGMRPVLSVGSVQF